MSSTETTDVVVVGAGGGGGVLGLALAKKGIECIVLEQAAGPPEGLRGEILQPNGQEVLEKLGLLERLPTTMVREVRYFHFCRSGGERLCTIDYGVLPLPFNRALVTLPNAVHHLILDELSRQRPGSLRYDTSFKGLVKDHHRVIGVIADHKGQKTEIRTKLVVGADGAFSKVREALGISAKVHLYSHGYLIAILDNPEGIDEGRYFVGKHSILGIFPAAGEKVYVFYMIAAGSMDQLKREGIASLREKWIAIDPSLSRTFESLQDWNHTAYMPTGRVRVPQWVAEGAALIGDAAHAMNPHASQGRMQAMVDAMTLAEVVEESLSQEGCTLDRLREFERLRRPQVETLQKMADEQVLFWNTGNLFLSALRDRVFRTLDRNQRLRFQVLSTTAGFRSQPPFGMLDRFMAAGFLPDPRSHVIPPIPGRTLLPESSQTERTWSA